LTLLSCLYVRISEPTFFGRGSYSKQVLFGFPAPVFTAQQYIGESSYSNKSFVLAGALIDTMTYVLIIWIVFMIGSGLAKRIKNRNP
jgi:hypothetical protein